MEEVKSGDERQGEFDGGNGDGGKSQVAAIGCAVSSPRAEGNARGAARETSCEQPEGQTTRNGGGSITTVAYGDLLEQALAYSRAGTIAALRPSVSKTGVASTESVGRAGVGAGAVGSEVAEIQAVAAALLRHLIVDKQESLRAQFHKIPFLPQVREGGGLVSAAENRFDEFGSPGRFSEGQTDCAGPPRVRSPPGY